MLNQRARVDTRQENDWYTFIQCFNQGKESYVTRSCLLLYVDTRLSTRQGLIQDKTMLDVIDDYNMKQATELKELYSKPHYKV